LFIKAKTDVDKIFKHIRTTYVTNITEYVEKNEVRIEYNHKCTRVKAGQIILNCTTLLKIALN